MAATTFSPAVACATLLVARKAKMTVPITTTPTPELGRVTEPETGEESRDVPEPEVGDNDRRRNDRPLADVAKDERQHGGQGCGSDDGPRQRCGCVDRQDLVEICGIEVQDRVRGEQAGASEVASGTRPWTIPQKHHRVLGPRHRGRESQDNRPSFAGGFRA